VRFVSSFTHAQFGLANLVNTIGACDDCFRGQHRYCSSKKIIGFGNSYGGFSEYALADPRSTVKIPDALSFDMYALHHIFENGVTG